MSLQALNQGDIYYDPVLNAVLQADGVISTNNNHQFTMLWPSYTALDMHDSLLKRLMVATYDHWNNVVDYYDPGVCMTIKIDLSSGMSSSTPGTPQAAPQTNTHQSQQNWGWSTKDEEKKPKNLKPSFPFKAGSALFHKESRTKWIFTEIDSMTRQPVLRSFYDKSKAMQVFETDYQEYEEIFF